MSTAIFKNNENFNKKILIYQILFFKKFMKILGDMQVFLFQTLQHKSKRETFQNISQAPKTTFSHFVAFIAAFSTKSVTRMFY